MIADPSRRIDPAMAEALAARAGDDPAALIQIARLLSGGDQHEKARDLASRAAALAPGDARIRTLASQIMSREVAQWHFTIVRDRVRNRAYDAAIRRAVDAAGPGARVLDIGAGTGLLAMMAARAGASHVVTCEMNPTVADFAARVVARNGLSDKVRVVARHSTALDPEQDLGGRVDILVSETISNDVVGEDWFPALEDAVARLCVPHARIIPARTIARVALAHDRQAARWRMGEVDGFDLSPFDALAPDRYQIRSESPRLTLRSSPGDLFDFDFAAGGPFPAGDAEVEVEATGGEVNGIVQWMAVGLDETIWYENVPGPESCWAMLFYPLKAPCTPPAGERVRIHGSHDRRRMIVWSDVG